MVSESITCHVKPDGTVVEISPIPRRRADIEQIQEAVGYLTVEDSPVVKVDPARNSVSVNLAPDVTYQAARDVLGSVGCQVI